MDISTPAVVFPAISFLILAFTNRFIAISKRVRILHDQYQLKPSKNLEKQIKLFHKRLLLIRDMQILGATSFLLSIVSMILIFLSLENIASTIFIISLVVLVCALIISAIEIYHSVHALSLHLEEDIHSIKDRII